RAWLATHTQRLARCARADNNVVQVARRLVEAAQRPGNQSGGVKVTNNTTRCRGDGVTDEAGHLVTSRSPFTPSALLRPVLLLLFSFAISFTAAQADCPCSAVPGSRAFGCCAYRLCAMPQERCAKETRKPDTDRGGDRYDSVTAAMRRLRRSIFFDACRAGLNRNVGVDRIGGDAEEAVVAVIAGCSITAVAAVDRGAHLGNPLADKQPAFISGSERIAGAGRLLCPEQ